MLATDASEWGLGVVSIQRLAADVRFACKFSERWRFKHGQGPAREGMGELDTPEDATRASSADLPILDMCHPLDLHWYRGGVECPV